MQDAHDLILIIISLHQQSAPLRIIENAAATALRRVRVQERERCAQIADQLGGHAIAAALRALPPV